MLRHHRNKIVLLCVAGGLTVMLQVWIGLPRLYNQNIDNRQLIHQAILDGYMPQGRTWSEFGANGLNKRWPVVELAEAARQVSGLKLRHVYLAQDSVFLFLLFLLLFRYLRHFLPVPWAALGVAWFAAVAPLTYLFHYFHPWDRPLACMWMIALPLLYTRRHKPLFAAVAGAMMIKPDMLLLPFLYAATTRDDPNRRTWMLRSAGLLALTGGIYVTQMLVWPQEPNSITDANFLSKLGEHLADVGKFGPAYPPVLYTAPLAVLIIAGWRHLETYHRWAFGYVVGMLSLVALAGEFREARAQTPFFLMMLPAALLVIKQWVNESDAPADELLPRPKPS